LIVGDCLGNLRASLDYVAWQLASINRSPKIGVDRGISFPISRDGMPPNGLANLSGIWAVPAAAITIIESIQPYHAGYEMLGALSALINQDKHCLPLLTIASARAHQTTVIKGDKTIAWWSGGSQATFYFNTPMAWPPGEVKVEGDVAVFVTLQDVAMPVTPVDRLLEDIVKTVADIIPRFEPFF
jgi:hypothetical protein